MGLLWRNSPKEDSRQIKRRCNHPLALVLDPTENELRDLEAMLAKCPNCSQWTPGDGPILAILSSHENADLRASKELL